MANKSKVEYEKAYARYKVELEEFKNAHPEWQFECDRIGREHAAAALKALDEHIATQTVPPNGSSLGISSDDHLRLPEKPESILNISPSRAVGSSENIIEGLKNGSVRLEPKNEIILENVELVMATREDEQRKKSSSAYRRGNVGLRCIHCKHLPRSEQKKRALLFPKDASAFSIGIGNFRNHFRICNNVSKELRTKIENISGRPLPDKYVSALPYCKAVAEELGIEDDPNGTVRFSIDVPRGEEPTSFLIKPGVISTNPYVPTYTTSISLLAQDNRRQHHTSEQMPSLNCNYCKKSFTTSNGLKYHLDHAVCQKISQVTHDLIADSEQATQGANSAHANASDEAILEQAISDADSTPNSLILPSERVSDATDALYLLINQFSICNLTKAEQNTGARGHLPIGLAGLKCKYCSKTMFWGGSKEFVKVNEKLSYHLQMCTFAPAEKMKAIELAKLLRREQVNKRGLVGNKSHAAFSGRMYERLVSCNSSVDASASTSRALPAHRLMKSCASSNASSGDVGISSSSAFWEELDVANGRKEAEALFSSSQRQTTTDFNYLVIRQFSLCRRSSQEHRSRYPIGYPGLCCTHCQTKMYFPDSSRYARSRMYGTYIFLPISDFLTNNHTRLSTPLTGIVAL